MTTESIDVPSELDVHSPGELESLLSLLSRLLDAGALKQCEPLDSSQASLDLRKLPPAGPWPDIVEAEFTDGEGRRYHLFVDTFHGTGGQWRVID